MEVSTLAKKRQWIACLAAAVALVSKNLRSRVEDAADVASNQLVLCEENDESPFDRSLFDSFFVRPFQFDNGLHLSYVRRGVR